jgi:uncharacterized protein YqeY
MSLLKQIDDDMKQAMRDKEKVKLSVIRMVKASLKNEEINKRAPLTEEDALTILNRELKQRRDSLVEFEKAGRDDLIKQLQEEIEIILPYLPQQLSEQELQEIIKSTISEVGAERKSDIGKVMAALMPKVKGKADGKLVNALVQQNLQ